MSASMNRKVWRYGSPLRENGRIVRNGDWYYALIRVDDIRWHVLAGRWNVQRFAFHALCVAHRVRFERFLTADNYDLDKVDNENYWHG